MLIIYSLYLVLVNIVVVIDYQFVFEFFGV